MNVVKSERGAAAVEFAMILPLLILIFFGIIEFGRAYNIQLGVTQAARETVRHMAIKGDWVAAQAHGRAASPSLQGAQMQLEVSPASCATGDTVTVVVKYPFDSLTGIAGDMMLTGKAAMRCGG
ncbi:TadE family protein [Kocuria flava]|uniref:TadE/TadG family type IV pilus assembly protein n=1 Tax=Kocuria flava TaxID=446860 RepID=UPI002F937B72